MADNDKDKNWEKLRNKAENLEAELSSWKKVALERTVEQAGFDPDVGVVKMTLDAYAGADDLDPSSVDPSDFREFAVNQGLEPVDVTEEVTEEDTGDESTVEQKIIERNQADADELRQVTSDSEPSSLLQEADEALLDGDVDKSIAKKIGALDEL